MFHMFRITVCSSRPVYQLLCDSMHAVFMLQHLHHAPNNYLVAFEDGCCGRDLLLEGRRYNQSHTLYRLTAFKGTKQRQERSLLCHFVLDL